MTTERRMTAFYMALILFGAIVSSNAVNATTLLFDDFNDGNDDGWTQQLGTWSAATGQYTTVTPDDDFYAVRGNSSWSNYILEADIKMDAWENNVGLVFYSQANTDHIRFTYNGPGFNPDSIFLEHGQWDSLEGEFVHTSIATFINTDLNLANDTWYNFKVVIAGDSVAAYIDDVLYASADSLPYSSGKIGLTWDNGFPLLAASFDNVQVSTVPLPAALPLFFFALAGLSIFGNHRKLSMG